MQNSIPCDVVLLPDYALSAKAVGASQSLDKFDSLFTLDNANFYAHASLYMLELKAEDLGRAANLIASIAKSVQTFSAIATRYDQKERFADAEYAVTPELSELQVKIIEALNGVRNGMRAKDRERMLSATGLALENYQQYGYKPIGDLFRPHMTLTRFSNEPVGDVEAVLPEVREFNGTFNRIGLFEMGDNGTCIREIGSWKLL
jgi:hypothetical protein